MLKCTSYTGNSVSSYDRRVATENPYLANEFTPSFSMPFKSRFPVLSHMYVSVTHVSHLLFKTQPCKISLFQTTVLINVEQFELFIGAYL